MDEVCVHVIVRVTPPDAVVSFGFANGLLSPGKRLAGGRCVARVPPSCTRIMAAVGLGDTCIEDAVYEIDVARLGTERTAIAPRSRSSDTMLPTVFASTLSARLAPKSPTLAEAHQAAMTVYNAAAAAEVDAMRIAVMPEGTQTLAVLSEFGLVPITYMHLRPARFAPNFASAMLRLMCDLDESGVRPTNLPHAAEDVVARVLSRVTLLACSVRYTPDKARTRAGPQMCNLFSDPMLAWRDDCEGCALVTWWVWREMLRAAAAAHDAALLNVLNRYSFYVLICSFSEHGRVMQHMCSALLPAYEGSGLRGVLLESTTRTCGLVRTDGRAPGGGEERALVRTADGVLNNWYRHVHLMFNPEDCDTLYVPKFGGANGVALVDLLQSPHKVGRTPLETRPPADLLRAMRRNFEDYPAADLREVAIQHGARGPDAGSEYSAAAPHAYDNAIRVPGGEYYVLRARPTDDEYSPPMSESWD